MIVVTWQLGTSCWIVWDTWSHDLVISDFNNASITDKSNYWHQKVFGTLAHHDDHPMRTTLVYSQEKTAFLILLHSFFLSYFITRMFSASSCTTPVEDSVESLFLKISLAKQCFKGYYDPTFVDPVRVLADRDPIGSNPDPGFVNDQSSGTRQNFPPKMEVLEL